jgi:hypothetical protein
MSPENATRMLQALEQFGFASLDLQLQDFMTPDQVIQLGYPPSRIDLLTTPDGVNFATCYAVKIEINIDGVLVNFIDLNNLRLNKKRLADYRTLLI